MCVLLNLLWQRRNLAPQLPYSPDLAPSDFNLFGALNDGIPGKRLERHEEVAASSEFKLSECDREASTMMWSWPTKGCCAMDIYIYIINEVQLIKKYKGQLTCLVILLICSTS
jgi:hypothetical protein